MTKQQQPIRRTASGSIDTVYHCNHARDLRAAAIKDVFKGVSVAKVGVFVVAILVAIITHASLMVRRVG